MKIRALTGFLDPGWPLDSQRVARLGAGLQACRSALQDTGYEVQTLRLAAPPPAEMEQPVAPAERPELARALEAECFVQGLDYAALGPALPEEPQGYDVIPEVLDAAQTVFASALFADPQEGLALGAARACAEVICRASTLSPDGFANLRFAALANVPAGTPFFPAAFHRGGAPGLAVATEAADLAVAALRESADLAEARRRLVSDIENHAEGIRRITQRMASEHTLQFLGIDFSLAPFPVEERSIGTALAAFREAPAERVSVLGAAFLTDCLDRAQFARAGFCGLFLPVLEDAVLARLAAQGDLRVEDLLLLSTVCGTGLDTVPLPGDAEAEALYAILLDLGAVALRLNKPLTARLMPIPGKAAGDEIHFDFPYFADSRVMALLEASPGAALDRSTTLHLGVHMA